MFPATADETIPRLYFMTIEELTSLEKLNKAFYECSTVSYWKESTQRYRANLLANNIKLQEDVRNGTYKVDNTINFTIHERGKVRYINAPKIRDRVLQKVLCQQILIPQLSVPLIYDNYASLKNRGTSFARKRLNIMLRRYIRQHGSDGYILQIDIKKYFNSIDHEVLRRMIHDRVHEDKRIMNLIDYVIDTSSNSDKGLNLGAEAPQIFAVYYLSGLDNFIKSVKGIKYYGRYMDDMFVISHDKEQLKKLLVEIKKQLAGLKLEVNENKTHIIKLSHGFTFMQIKYNIDNGKIIKRPTHSKIVRERKRLKKFKKKYDAGLMTEFNIYNCYKSWRNSILKDCNACQRTIYEMDKLYNSLFPKHKDYRKELRPKLVRDAFRELGQYFEQYLEC